MIVKFPDRIQIKGTCIPYSGQVESRYTVDHLMEIEKNNTHTCTLRSGGVEVEGSILINTDYQKVSTIDGPRRRDPT